MMLSRLTNFVWLRHRHPSMHEQRDARVASRPPDLGAAAEAAAEQESEIVEIRGVFVGVAAPHALGFRFVAADRSVLDMSESIWPTLDRLRAAVAQRRRAFLRTRGLPFPWLHFRRSGAALATDHEPELVDHARLTLDNFDW